MAAKKGARLVLLLLFLLLAVAGGSAWLIHQILEGGDPAASEAAGSSDISETVAKVFDSVRQKIMGDTAGSGKSEQLRGTPQTAPAPLPNASSALEAVVLGPDGKEVPAREGIPSGPDARDGRPAGIQPPPIGDVPGSVAGRNAPPGGIVDNGDSASAEMDAVPLAENMLVAPGSAETPPAARDEDPVVRPAFIDNFAAFLAGNYWPKGTHPAAVNSGLTTVSPRWANLRYGAELRGLDGGRSDPGPVRNAILKYVLNPATVDSLFNLYADSFVAALRQGADTRVLDSAAGRSLTAEEKREMFAIYSHYAARLSAALSRYAGDKSIRGKVEAYAAAEEAVQEANRTFMESSLLHENELESRDRQKIAASRLRMDKDAAAYQRTIREREAKRSALVVAMGGAGPDDGTLLYTAFWAYRRGANSVPGLEACARALSNLSAKLSAAGKKIQP